MQSPISRGMKIAGELASLIPYVLALHQYMYRDILDKVIFFSYKKFHTEFLEFIKNPTGILLGFEWHTLHTA